MTPKSAWKITKNTFSSFSEDRVLRLSAAMAYYAIFSIGPLLVLIAGLAGLVFGEDTVRKEISSQLQSMVGAKSAHLVETMMTSRQHGTSLIATIVGGIGLVFGASGVFGQLQDALNTIWEVKSKPGAGILGFLRQRFLSLSMVLGIGFLLLVSMALSTFIHGFAGYLGGLVSLPQFVLPALNGIASFVVITLLFALIFKVLPDVEVRWADVWIGAIGTSILFTIGKFLLTFYLGRAGTTSAYGAGASFVLILMYIYYSSVILFFGAEFTQVYAHRQGKKVRPSKYAIPVTEDERAEQGTPRGGKKPRLHEDQREPFSPLPSPAAHSTVSTQVATGDVMGEEMKKEKTPDGLTAMRRPPGERIKKEPWSFVGLALAMGVAAGVMLRFKSLRRALKVYSFVRRLG